MSTKKKIIAHVVAGMLAIPALLIFNNDPTRPYLNVIGFVYAWAVVRFAPSILPKWMMDYFEALCDDKEV
jgi:hypothetical protein